MTLAQARPEKASVYYLITSVKRPFRSNVMDADPQVFGPPGSGSVIISSNRNLYYSLLVGDLSEYEKPSNTKRAYNFILFFECHWRKEQDPDR
jgi:hypothetical protein